jgi:hypothetical protein
LFTIEPPALPLLATAPPAPPAAELELLPVVPTVVPAVVPMLDEEDDLALPVVCAAPLESSPPAPPFGGGVTTVFPHAPAKEATPIAIIAPSQFLESTPIEE